MPEEIQVATPAAGSAGEGNPVVGDGGQPQSTPDSNLPGQGDQQSQESRARGGDGRFAPKPEPAARPLEELMSLGANVGEMTTAERKAVRLGARLGLSTQAEYEAEIAKQPGAKPPQGAPPLNPKPNLNQPGKADPLSTILQAISPNLDPTKPELAVQSIRELQGKVTQMGDRNKQLEDYYPAVQEGIVSRLNKGPEGVKELFAAFNIPVPAWIGQGSAPAASAAPAADPALNGFDLSTLKDEDYVDGKSIKGLIGSLAQTISTQLKSEFEKDYGPLKQSHEKIVNRITQDAQAEEIKQRRIGAFEDLDFHSKFMGRFSADDKLSAKAADIWAASFDEGTRTVKATPHPEWPKFQKMLTFRKAEYLEKGDKSSSYPDFLRRHADESGLMDRHEEAIRGTARTAQLTAQQRRVQPAVVTAGSGKGGLDSLVIPKSVQDVEGMSKEQRHAYLAAVHSGKIPS